MQEEALRERSEKEALRNSNQRLQMQVDKLLKVAASRTPFSSARQSEPVESSSVQPPKTDPVADAEAFLECRIAAFENSQGSTCIGSGMMGDTHSSELLNSVRTQRIADAGDIKGKRDLVEVAATGLAAAKRIAAAASTMASMRISPPPSTAVTSVRNLVQCPMQGSSTDAQIGDPEEFTVAQ